MSVSALHTIGLRYPAILSRISIGKDETANADFQVRPFSVSKAAGQLTHGVNRDISS